MTPTTAELREEADALGVDLTGLSRKADIEDAVASAHIDSNDSDSDGDVDDVDDDVVDDVDDDIDDADDIDDIDDVTPSQLPPTPQQLYTKTINSFRDPNLGNEVNWERYHEMVPPRPHTVIPRMVRGMDYATLELTARQFTTRMEVRKGSAIVIERGNFQLPEDHNLTGAQLQNLVTALIAVSESGYSFPDWQDFAQEQG